MQRDFHYYATYAAAVIAGYSHEEACDICWSAYHVDKCTRSFIHTVRGPLNAATTQSKGELVNVPMDKEGVHDVTRIWSSFHFLPKDLNPEFKGWRSKRYKQAYSLICGPNSELVKQSVELAKGKDLQSVGIAMHVLADTWAHAHFAGTPSLVINNRDNKAVELLPDGSEKRIKFTLRAARGDNLEKNKYIASVFQEEENTTLNLGHGRIGHLPDYSFIRYRYRPAWLRGKHIVKDNPSDYYHAFCQMVYAMKYLRGDVEEFELDTYADAEVEPWREQIEAAINKRATINCEDWKALGEQISGREIPDYDRALHSQEYRSAQDKEESFLGKYFEATRRQKRMVSTAINESNNKLAGSQKEIFRADESIRKGLLGVYKKLIGLKGEDDE